MRTLAGRAFPCAVAGVILVASGSAWAQPTGFDGHQVVKIEVADEAQLETLRALDAASRDIEIWSEVLHVGVIEARVSPEQKRKLDASGLMYTVHIEDLQAHINEMYADRGGGFCDQYRTYDEHIAFLSDLAAQYPTLAQTVDLGQSVEGRTLLAIRITGPGDHKVGLLYHGAQHGNEQAGAMLVAYTANHLLTNYATDPEIQSLVDNVEWYLLPIMNPDGYERYTRENRNWVDLNRNWGGPGSGDDWTGGPYPFSEPETAALRDFLVEHPAVRLHLDLHGYINWFIWSWGHKADHAPHHDIYYSAGVEVRDLIEAAGGSYYNVGSIWDVAYTVSGGSVDYSYGVLNRLGYTLELTDSNIPGIYDHYLSSLLYLASWVSDCDGGSAADCNDNGVPDECDIAYGTTTDCNANLVPDECDITNGTSEDCDLNGMPDDCDVDYGTDPDCNTNAVPDECDVADATSEDCNLNLVPDECELDCNENTVPDECDISDGTSEDCNSNEVPDECDVDSGTALDCNANAVPDECDLADGASEDCNLNEIPDECDLVAGTASGFLSAVSYGVGDGPRLVAVGDLDDDGHDDLAVASEGSDEVSVLLGNGDGTFAAAVSLPVGDGPCSVAIGDLDNDGDYDLATANARSDDASVLMNNGNGTFAAAVSYRAGNNSHSVAIADLDHDGDNDLAVASRYSDDVSVLMNDGNGTFAPAVSYVAGNGPVSVGVGDLDHDGDADLVVADFDGEDVSVLLNYSDGTFAPPVFYGTDRTPQSVAIGDLDEDGDEDLAIPNRDCRSVSVLMNHGDGTFAAKVQYQLGQWPCSVAIGDLDNDGDKDLAVATRNTDNMSVLLNNGDGTFGGALLYPTGDGPFAVAMGDWDHDGDNDLAVANQIGDDVSVLMNRVAANSVDCNFSTIPDECESFETCDFGGDGDVDLHDWGAFVDCLAGPGVGPGPAVERCVDACLAAFDLDSDGDVDLLDAAGSQELYTGGARPLCWVEGSAPADGWIDARQPIDNSVDQNPAGWREVEITFDSECEASLIEAGDFSIAEVCEPGECDEVAPGVAGFAGAGDVGTLTLDRPIDPKAWTVITFHGEYADDVIRLGYLPGDADGSSVSNAGDIVEAVEGVSHGGPLHQFDIDRSGMLTQSDYVVLIDLLNGAEPFESYLYKQLPPWP